MAVSAGRREAAMAIWPWRASVGGTARADAAGALRMHGVTRGGIALAVASGFWFLRHPAMATVVAVIGGTTLLAALVSPHVVYARFSAAMEAFARGVGTVLTYLFLVPIYFLIITPFGLLMRRGSRDPLHRTWSAQTPSFWTTRPATDDAPERRKRPF